jgi:hypothetical protein
MAIFNKDGKVYVLEGPNPLVDKQVKWEQSQLIFHNFNWDEVTMKGQHTKKPPKPQPERPESPLPAPIPVPIARDEPKEIVQEDTSSPAEPKRDFDLPHIKHKVLSYCLPAKVERKTDKLYGESWMKVSYGKKIVFPSVMTDVSDFAIEFWTSDPNEQITEKSIIYPFSYEIHNSSTGSYDRVPYDEYRWWKVSEKKKIDEGGWLFRAVPSDSQPDFSD